jgi:ribosomal protein S18 acetylase RimI-like enzyme
MTKSVAIEQLGQGDLAAAGETLGLAMASDPFYRYLLPDDGRRTAWTCAFMTDLLRLLEPAGQVYGIGAQGLDAVIGLSPPAVRQPPWSRAVPFALKRLFGRGPSWSRLYRAYRTFSAAEQRRPDGPHWHLVIAGVRPESQGRHLGHALLGLVLTLADHDQLPIQLETSNQQNVGFYERFGFSVVEQLRRWNDVPPLWIMSRAARPAGTQ